MHEAVFLGAHFTSQRMQSSPFRKLKFNMASEQAVAATTAYCASVRALQQAIDRHGRVAVPAALVCCILFAAFHMLQYDYDDSIRHIEYGLGIVAKEQRIERCGGGICVSGWSATAEQGAMAALVSGFHRLSIAVFFYGRPNALLQGRIIMPNSSSADHDSCGVVLFKDIDEARVSLSIVAASTLKFTAEVIQYQRDAEIPPVQHFQERQRRLEYLDSWRASLGALTPTIHNASADETKFRMLQIVLESQILALVVLVRTSLDADESGYDACFDEFRQILILCEEYITLYSSSLLFAGAQHRTESFTFDMEILPQLWLIGKKCRHRQYRRWAINLLQKYHRKEGVWDPALICNLTKRAMEIEEQNISPRDLSLPSDFDRLWSVDLDSRYVDGSVALFAYKPATLGGRGLSWEEMIFVDPDSK